MTVMRHFVECGHGLLHYRRLGQGPAVVLLHATPRSSVELMALGERIAHRFTVFAFDTPGYGDSDPLRVGYPSCSDYADAIAEAMRRLGLARVPVYGTHTGALVAVELARRHHDRVAALMLDGYPLFSDREREEFLANYFPPLRFTGDGGHIAWIWLRVRDGVTFYPWNVVGRTARLGRDQPPLSRIQEIAFDYLRAGEAYALAYFAAFRHESRRALDAVDVPVAITCREDDLLFGHLDRAPSGVKVTRLTADRDAWAASITDMLAPHAAQPAPTLTETPALRGFITVDGLRLHVRRGGAGLDAPIMLIHRTPGDSSLFAPAMQRLRRPAVAIDLPGAGLSAGWPDGLSQSGDLTVLIAKAAHALGSRDVLGEGSGANLAAAVARQLGPDLRRLAVLDPWPSDVQTLTALRAQHAVDLAPTWDGAHLLRAWWREREMLLYKPWFARTRAAARAAPIGLDLAHLHRAFIAALAGAAGEQALTQALFSTGVTMLDAPCAVIGYEGAPPGNLAPTLVAAPMEPTSLAEAIETAFAHPSK